MCMTFEANPTASQHHHPSPSSPPSLDAVTPAIRPTTKGCLVASTNRGCKAISQGGGCRAALLKDGITRAPCLRMPDAMAAADLKRWSEMPENFERIKTAFQTTTRFGER